MFSGQVTADGTWKTKKKTCSKTSLYSKEKRGEKKTNTKGKTEVS